MRPPRRAATRESGEAHRALDLFPPVELHAATLTSHTRPAYCTPLGAMYEVDAGQLLRSLPDNTIDLVVTSPPYALHFKKEYGNADKDAYVEWFRPFATEIMRVLTPQGSFVLNIGGSYNAGTPTRPYTISACS
jgi:site-specific DNA-methyltransferase (cytosine-N4-specific)